MGKINQFLLWIDGYLSGHPWFVILLLGTGIFFTIYLRFPQIRYFKYAIQIVKGKFDRHSDVGDASHFQALATALSGTVGTGNIAGVALALHLGGPPALFWMILTAMIGMTTKFVEVTLSHKYRIQLPDGSIAGGPMFFMQKRLNWQLKSGRVIPTGQWMAIVFTVATLICTFGSGNLPQINSIASAVNESFGVPHVVTGLLLALVLGSVIIGGIKRIVKVSDKLVPFMAIAYFLGAFVVLICNYNQILPGLAQMLGGIVSGTAATGGFVGASVAFALNRGVNRGLFSNEAGQGSAPIAHAAARAHEPVSEGLVAILEPFIDTIIICTLTGLMIVSTGVWSQKFENNFQLSDMQIVGASHSSAQVEQLALHLSGEKPLELYQGSLQVVGGAIANPVSVIHARSWADSVRVTYRGEPYTGSIEVVQGKPVLSGFDQDQDQGVWGRLVNGNTHQAISFSGYSLVHSVPLTIQAFSKSWFGGYGHLLVTFSLFLFAFSTVISWSYYGDRAAVFLWGPGAVRWFRISYVIVFFLGAIIDTTIVWNIAGISIVLMALPNLIGLLLLHREMKDEVRKFWEEYQTRFPDEKAPVC